MDKNRNQVTMDVLNSLIHINNSHILGYQEATKETKDEDLQIVFSAMLNESVHFAENLAGYVREMGGEVAIERVMEGSVYRVWINVKTIIESYDTALKVEEIRQNPEIKGVLERQKIILEESLKILEHISLRLKYKAQKQEILAEKV